MKRLALLLAITCTLAAACSDDDATEAGDSTTSSSIEVEDTSTTNPPPGAEDAPGCSDAEIVESSADFFVNPADPSSVPSIIGLADVDGDGEDELWAQTGQGASTTILGLALRDGCTLARVHVESGGPAEFPVGGTIGAASGLVCGDTEDEPDLTTYSLLNIGGDEYEATSTEYTLEGDTLVETSSDAASVSADDPSFGRYSGFSCGELAAG